MQQLASIFRIPIQLKLGLYQSGSFHPASQTKLSCLQPSGSCIGCFHLRKKQQTSNEGGWFLRRVREQLRGMGVPQQHRQPLADPPSPDSTDPKISAFSNVTFTWRLCTVRTLDRRTSWAPRRNNTMASIPSSKEPPLPSTPSFWEWVALSTTITRWILLRNWVLIPKELKARFQAFCSFCQLRCQTCYTRRALLNTNID